MTTYKLTLRNGTRNSLNAPATLPAPYNRDCGHRHRSPVRAANCYVPGQPGGMAPVSVVAVENGVPRKLNCEELNAIADAESARYDR